MKENKTREELENNLVSPTLNIKRKRNIVYRIKNNLFDDYKILDGNVQSWINDPENELSELDWRVLYLFAEQIYIESKINNIDPDNFYTEVEAKKAKQYSGRLTMGSDINLPIVFNDAIELGFGRYITYISAKRLAEMSSTLLHYNFDIQREATKTTRNNETIKEATLVMSNVKEIKNHLKKNTLQPTNIVFNAAVGTSDDGDEITYNPETKQLQVNEGTIIDIVDGYHRCKGSELALNENPDIDFNFALTILNYTDDQAAQYQGQLAEATPISKPKRKQLSQKRHADAVVKEVMNNSELRNKVAIAHVPRVKSGELVTYEILSDTIHDQFKLEKMIDVYKVSDYLKAFFDILLGEYSEQFIENPSKWKKDSVMVENNMFIGYLILAKHMYESDESVMKLVNYINEIDFSRDNKTWVDIGFLNKEGSLTETKAARESIRNYFARLCKGWWNSR